MDRQWGGGQRPRGDDRAAGGGAFAAVQAKRRAGAQRVEEGKKVEGSQLSRRLVGFLASGTDSEFRIWFQFGEAFYEFANYFPNLRI